VHHDLSAEIVPRREEGRDRRLARAIDARHLRGQGLHCGWIASKFGERGFAREQLEVGDPDAGAHAL
jgi:hypothetical protein